MNGFGRNEGMKARSKRKSGRRGGGRRKTRKAEEKEHMMKGMELIKLVQEVRKTERGQRK